jgi:hypothetical protein
MVISVQSYEPKRSKTVPPQFVATNSKKSGLLIAKWLPRVVQNYQGYPIPSCTPPLQRVCFALFACSLALFLSANKPSFPLPVTRPLTPGLNDTRSVDLQVNKFDSIPVIEKKKNNAFVYFGPGGSS